MTLVLQTNIAGKLHLWVLEPGRIRLHRTKSIVWHGSEQALSFLVQSLQRAKLAPKKLKSIIVVRGPGPFTAVRTGIIIAQTLGYVWNVPVAGLVRKHALTSSKLIELSTKLVRTKKAVRPWYGKRPNITVPKR